MIRICALDFLNRDSFESDVKLADGKVIISAGEKITPELILMLYFKEIYVEKPLSDVIPGQLSDTLTTASPITIVDYTEEKAQSENDIAAPFDTASSETQNEVSLQEPFEQNQENIAKQEVAQEMPFEKTPKQPELDLGESSFAGNTSNSDLNIASSKVPDAPELDLEKTVPDNPLESGVDLGKKYSEDEEPDLTEADEAAGKTPVAPTLDLGDDFEAGAESGQQEEKPKEELARVLKFDEDLAKEMAENAVKLAKELNLPAITISDIEKAALICDIGLDDFTIENVRERGFEQKKAKVSYEKAVKRGMYSNEVLEIVKCHAKPYVSENFDLNPNIPSGDVLHIACLYSRYLYLGMSKEQALLKMLEQGGNEYNIFALHKFLRIMRNG